jgi:hypothetical protein
MKPKSKWKQPKYILNEFLIYLSIICLLISSIAVFTYYIWSTGTNLFVNLDYDYFDYESKKVEQIYIQTSSLENDEEKLKGFKKILSMIGQSSNQHKTYHMFVNAKDFIIEDLIKTNQMKEAKMQTLEWMQNYPYDFRPKLKYAKLLKESNINEIVPFYDNLLEKDKYSDFYSNLYVTEMLELGEFSKAFKIAKESKEYLISNLTPNFSFLVKYIPIVEPQEGIDAVEINPEFSQMDIRSEDLTVVGNQYFINTKLTIDQFQELAFKFNLLKNGTYITNFNAAIKTSEFEYPKLKIEESTNLETVGDKLKTQAITDVSFLFKTPDPIKGYTGNIDINISFNIEINSAFILEKITQHPDWKVEIINDDSIHSERIKFIEQQNKFKTLPINVNSNHQQIKFKAPFFRNMSLNNIALFNEGLKSKFHIIDSNNMDLNDKNQYTITGPDPFLLFDVGQKTGPYELALELEIIDE